MVFQSNNKKSLLFFFQESGRSLCDWQQTFATFKIGIISSRGINSTVLFNLEKTGHSIGSKTCAWIHSQAQKVIWEQQLEDQNNWF